MRTTQLQQLVANLLRGPAQTALRSSRTVLQIRNATFGITLRPLVPRLAAHSVALAQLRHRVQTTVQIANESLSLLHSDRLVPGHRVPPFKNSMIPFPETVTHLPGLVCYPCLRSVPTRASGWAGLGPGMRFAIGLPGVYSGGDRHDQQLR